MGVLVFGKYTHVSHGSVIWTHLSKNSVVDQYFYTEKEHTSEIGWLETSCIAMFVAMCSSCRLILTVREGCHEDAVVVADKLFMSKPVRTAK
jgi:hypothetical protein